ncbi:MAG: tetratricopeptide repeat protein [Candidatus Aminicenantes bacterium]|nr:tetratricopeptide repeat protein [Candidatus Aminicenantes bacterium]
MAKLRSRGILKTLVAFVGGSVVAIEFAFHILVHHYHLPSQTVDIIIIKLVTAFLCVVTWQWFAGEEKPRKIKFEMILIFMFISIGGILIFNQVRQIGREKLGDFTEYETQEWDNSIAVLPFENMSGDPEQEYFCDGLTEDLITDLSNIEDLKVVARTSVFAFKGKQDDIRKIGEELNVKNVLEGSVRKSNDQLRITAQLIDVNTGFHRWSGRFDRDMEDVFAIQDEITLAIVDALSLKLLGQDKSEVTEHETENSEAYNYFLRGRFHSNNRTEGGMKKGIEFFEKAVEADPNFALAYAEMAELYVILPAVSTVSTFEANAKAEEYALKALELDDTLAEAHTVVGDIKITDYDWNGAEREFKRAIELNPGYAHVYNKYGYSLMVIGRFEEAAEQMTKAIELDPYNLNYARNLSWIYYFEGNYEDAMSVLQGIIAINPGFSFVHLTVAKIFLQQSEFGEALDAVKKEKEAQGTWNPILDCISGIIYAKKEEPDKAREIFDDLLERSKELNISPYYLAGLSVSLNEIDRGFMFLERAYEDRDFWIRELMVDPLFEDVRSDPRYGAMLKKLRLKD